MQSEQAAAIEVTIDQAKKAVEIGEAVKRLEANPDFQKVIIEEFMETFAKQLVWQRAMPEFATRPEMVKRVDDKITAIGELRVWLGVCKQQGATAAYSIEVAERELANSEDLDEEGEE